MKKFAAMAMVLVLSGCGGKAPQPEVQKQEAQAVIQTGMGYLQQGDVGNAIKTFDEAIKADPMNLENYIVLGQVYLKLRNVDRAVDTFSAATRVAPNNGQVFFMLATAQALRGNRQEAIEQAKHSAEIFQSQKDAASFKKAVMLVQSLSSDVQAKVEGAVESLSAQSVVSSGQADGPMLP